MEGGGQEDSRLDHDITVDEDVPDGQSASEKDECIRTIATTKTMKMDSINYIGAPLNRRMTMKVKERTKE